MSQNDRVEQSGPFKIQVDSMFEHIIPIFVEEMREYVSDILSALESNDFHAIQATGHTIKGTASNLGINAISEIGKSLEYAARELDSKSVGYLMDELSACLEQIQVVEF